MTHDILIRRVAHSDLDDWLRLRHEPALTPDASGGVVACHLAD